MTDMDSANEAQIARDVTEPEAAADTLGTVETSPSDENSGETDSADGDKNGVSANREAAKYRRQLREVEAERDALAERLNALQRAQAEQIAASMLINPADLWLDGLALSDLLDDAGQIDPDKVRGAVDTLTERRPHWRRPPRKTPTVDGLRSGMSTSLAGAVAPSWAAVLQRR